MRVEPARVILRTDSARSGVGMNSPEPEKHVAVGVEAFGVLAHDHEIDRPAAARRKAAARCAPGGCWRTGRAAFAIRRTD